jgi:RNA polymerase sigma-70 factor (ECF subfamily)
MSIDDERLAVRCQLGEPGAFDALVARWHPALWTYARRITGSDDAAADAVQDAWLRVVRGLPRLREPARIRAWLFGIARRVLMDRLRAQYAAPTVVDLDPEEIHAALEPAPAGDADEQSAALQAGLDRLPVLERETLVLFYLRELSLAEIAAVLGIPEGTVKSRTYYALRNLRSALEERGFGAMEAGT